MNLRPPSPADHSKKEIPRETNLHGERRGEGGTRDTPRVAEFFSFLRLNFVQKKFGFCGIMGAS